MKHFMLPISLMLLMPLAALHAAAGPRPNILWISCEDTSPWLGFCGERYAHTPNLDRLAHEGVYYNNAFATAPACSPSRFAIITGCYATSYGTQRLRSKFPVPDFIEGFPASLRQVGYYCANNSKVDYNTSAEERIVAAAWDDSGKKAHWCNRKPGQPFFAVFNLMMTHQSKIFERTPPPKLDPSEQHDPSKAPVPPYYPDTPTARRTMARVHDCITMMDKQVGRILADLERDGLEDDTIVVFWPDHGQGIPRGKRTLWDTGLKIPLVVHFPEKYRHLAPVAPGSTCDRMVSLIDLGPTMLSMLELPIPPHMQGQAFLGKAAAAPRQYVFGARDRVDEAFDLSRSVRDRRYLYVRNFMPDLSWLQPECYSDRLELRCEITQLAAAGKLNEVQLTYAGPSKPLEALYDTENDPWQIKNVANDPKYRPMLERLRKALHNWQIETRDLGFFHECEVARLCASGRPVSEAAHADADYPLERILDTADRVGRPGETDEFVRRLSDANPTVRYWAAIGLRASGHAADNARDALRKALSDASPAVQIEAAGVLVARWDDADALERLTIILRDGDEHARFQSARTLQMLGEKARPALPAMQQALKSGGGLIGFSLQPAVRNLTVEQGSKP